MTFIKYSFVVPIYNDAYLAHDFCVQFQKTFASITNSPDVAQSVELIFVNDGSTNDSLDTLRKLPQQFGFVKIIDLSRNFGQHVAISCGFRESKGQYVGRMNVDMQDPPSEIPKLLKVLEAEDVDIVIGQYPVRHSAFFEKLTSRAFFSFFNWLTGQSTPHNTSPLRVMNRRFLEAYNNLPEKTRFPQGLENWLGFRQAYVPTVHQPRIDKKSSYNFKSRIKLALEGAISFSDRPLKIMVYTGLLISVFGIGFVALLLIRKFLYDDLLAGYTSLISLIVFFSGLQILVVGITGLYIGKVLQETQNRPLYLIREKINFGDGNE